MKDVALLAFGAVLLIPIAFVLACAIERFIDWGIEWIFKD